MAKKNKNINIQEDPTNIPSNEDVRRLLEENVQTENTYASEIPQEQMAIEDELKPSRSSAILAIIAGILIILAGWSIYNYFSKKDVGNVTPEGTAEIANVDEEKTTTLDYEGIVPVIEEVIDKVEVKEKASITKEANENLDSGIITFNSELEPAQADDGFADSSETQSVQPSESYGTGTTESGYWTPNNYEKGDISGNSYTVVSGDTLWEISEAVYGTGTSWTQIAEANNITYLSNGNPLIIPGQVLTFP